MVDIAADDSDMTGVVGVQIGGRTTGFGWNCTVDWVDMAVKQVVAVEDKALVAAAVAHHDSNTKAVFGQG